MRKETGLDISQGQNELLTPALEGTVEGDKKRGYRRLKLSIQRGIKFGVIYEEAKAQFWRPATYISTPPPTLI